MKYKFRIALDNNNIIYFDEWAPAIVYFFDRITSNLNEIIEFYEIDSIVIVWVDGKGILSKKSVTIGNLYGEPSVRHGNSSAITID